LWQCAQSGTFGKLIMSLMALPPGSAVNCCIDLLLLLDMRRNSGPPCEFVTFAAFGLSDKHRRDIRGSSSAGSSSLRETFAGKAELERESFGRGRKRGSGSTSSSSGCMSCDMAFKLATAAATTCLDRHQWEAYNALEKQAGKL
jgi:hypothetical protein